MSLHHNFGAANGRKCVQYNDLFDDDPFAETPAISIRTDKRPASLESHSPQPTKFVRHMNRTVYRSIPVKKIIEPMLLSGVQTVSEAFFNSPETPVSNPAEDVYNEDNAEQPLQQLVAIEKYAKHEVIGQGSYGTVMAGKNLKNGQIVAIKVMKVHNDISNSISKQIAYREVQILRSLKNDGIVSLLDTVRYNQDSCGYDLDLVFEYCRFELGKIIANDQIKIELGVVKNLMKQFLTGLEFIHQHDIIHRDIKTSNILLTDKGVLKIADFGLARLVPKENSTQNDSHSNSSLTTPVVTLWYRAPELLLGATTYTTAIDLWSVGCVMSEFWTRKAILPGNSETQQIMNVLTLCGSISLVDWPEAKSLRIYSNVHLPRSYKCTVKQRMASYKLPEPAVELLMELFTLNPAKRISCVDALNHIFFFTPPWPRNLDDFIKDLGQAKWSK